MCRTFVPELWPDECVDCGEEDGEVAQDGEQPGQHRPRPLGAAQAAAVWPLGAFAAVAATGGGAAAATHFGSWDISLSFFSFCFFPVS